MNRHFSALERSLYLVGTRLASVLVRALVWFWFGFGFGFSFPFFFSFFFSLSLAYLRDSAWFFAGWEGMEGMGMDGWDGVGRDGNGRARHRGAGDGWMDMAFASGREAEGSTWGLLGWVGRGLRVGWGGLR